MLTLGVDVDGVLADFHSGWMAHYEQWFGHAPVENMKQWEDWDFPWKIPTAFKTETEFWTWIDAIPNFWQTLPPIPGALGALYRFQEAGHEVRLLTSRHIKTRGATRDWIRTTFPVHNGEHPVYYSKADEKAKIDCQVYIDDNPRTLEALRGRPCVVIFDAPYNKDVKSDERTHRLRGWGEVVQFLQGIDLGNG